VGGLIMCFEIGKKKVDRKLFADRTVVWKRVTVLGDNSVAGYYSYHNQFRYYPGVIHAKATDHKKFFATSNGRAHNGIYVYAEHADAIYNGRIYNPSWNYKDSGIFDTVIRLIVDPADLLVVNGHRELKRQATYKKVIVPEDQPYITWY
jgi:hypothetical protein